MHSKQVLEAIDRALKCAELALDKKAEQVKILEIKRLTTIADYLVIASGQSDRQAQAIADSVRQGLKKFGKPLDIEGATEGNWIVIDYGDVIVHVFKDEVRRYYNLEGVWEEAPEIPLPGEAQP